MPGIKVCVHWFHHTAASLLKKALIEPHVENSLLISNAGYTLSQSCNRGILRETSIVQMNLSLAEEGGTRSFFYSCKKDFSEVMKKRKVKSLNLNHSIAFHLVLSKDQNNKLY